MTLASHSRNWVYAFCLSSCVLACGPRGTSNDPLPVTDIERPAPTQTVVEPDPSDTALTTDDDVAEDVTPNAKKVPSFGSTSTFDIGAWNIEFFPKRTNSTEQVAKILRQLDLDLVAVEEISNSEALKALATSIPGYASQLVTEVGGSNEGQNVGFLYKTADLEILESEALFGDRKNKNKDDIFPRPVMKTRFRVRSKQSETPTEIIAMAVHLKAFEGKDEQAQRIDANLIIEEYISNLRITEPNVKVVVMGDFNERMDDEASRKVYDPWFNKAEVYNVATEPLAKRGEYSYYDPSRLSLIDHIIATKSLNVEEPQIPKLHQIVPNYQSTVSDHLPVLTRIY